VDQRIVVIENPLTAHPKTRVLKFQDPSLGVGVGTQLQNWLDGGRRATVYSITSSNVAGCTTPPQEPKCVRLEPFVVNIVTGQTISRPTRLFQHDHPTALYNEGLQPLPTTPEPFVSAQEAALFLSVKRRYLLELARRGIAGAYSLGTGSKRKVWVFRLSELAAAIARVENTRVENPIPNLRKPCTIECGSPR
jgi:hypothetical protein